MVLAGTLLLGAGACALAERPKASPAAPVPAPEAPSCNPPWEPYTPPKRDPRYEPMPSRRAPPKSPTPSPNLWATADHKRLQALQAVCVPAYRAETDDDRVHLGCHTCELRASEAPPLAVKTSWSGMRRGLEDVHWGSFTRPGADEAVLTFAGCERTVESDGMITEVGRGLALVERQGRHWRLRRYVGEVGHCEPTKRRDGRDALVCLGWGLDHHHRIKLVDWNAPELPTLVLDLTAPVLTDELCEQPRHTELATLKLTEYQLGDLDGDGIDDIRVHAKLTPVAAESVKAERTRPDFPLACACIKVMPPSEQMLNPRLHAKKGCRCPVLQHPFTPGKASDIELRFIETLGRFEPTPETKAALADLRRYHIAPPIVPGDADD
jgi:hypothetical protein